MNELKFVQVTKGNECQHIYEKDIPKQEILITIQISKYLTHTLAEKIAAAQWAFLLAGMDRSNSFWQPMR